MKSTPALVFDEFTGEMIDIEAPTKPVVWKLPQAQSQKPVSIAAKHSNASTWNAKSAKEYGAKGGVARALAITPQKRSEIAKKAALARWSK